MAARITPTSSRPFASKPVQQRERGIGQPFRAHPAGSSSVTGNPGQDRSAAGAATVAAASGNASGENSAAGASGEANDGSEGHKPFTPRSLALASGVSARLIASRAPAPQTGSTKSPSSFSSVWGTGGAVADGTPSQAHSGHGDHKNRDHQPLSRQLSRSTNASTASSPRASRASSPPSWAHDGDATLGYGCSSSSGVVAPPHGGRTDVGGGGGDAGGRRHNQGVMRPPKIGNNNVGSGSNSNSAASSASAAGSTGITTPPTQARGLLDGDNAAVGAAGEGVMLPGAEGMVEVREFDGGVLVVRRSEEEKKKSPERLNLHRRRLKSCPVVQVSSSYFGRKAPYIRLSSSRDVL